jgi:hypothetical protein
MPSSRSASATTLGKIALGVLLWAMPVAAAQPSGQAGAPSSAASSAASALPPEPPCPPGAYCERVAPVAPPPTALPSALPSEPPPPVTAPDPEQGAETPTSIRARTHTASPNRNPAYEGLPDDPYLRDGPQDDSAYHSGEPVPAGYHLESEPNGGLLIVGGGILGMSYLPMAIVGIAAAESDDANLAPFALLAVPVAGPPLLALVADAGQTVTDVTLCLAGAQAAGLLLVGLAFAFTSDELVRDDAQAVGPRAFGRTVVAPLRILPALSPAMVGLTLTGSL